jgi:hypothetical protein
MQNHTSSHYQYAVEKTFLSHPEIPQTAHKIKHSPSTKPVYLLIVHSTSPVSEATSIKNVNCQWFSAFNLIHTQQCSWLRHYTTSWKAAGSIPDEITGFFQFIQSFQPHYGQPLREMSTRNVPGEKSTAGS